MPVMVLFKIGGRLSIATINRRLNKRDESKDVLGKVTLIQNIVIEKPHPGHLDILASFSLAELTESRRVIQNFDQLHAAWEEVFNVELLNKRFYQELANWYFWALPQVRFPKMRPKDADGQLLDESNSLDHARHILLVLKEKGLLPDALFDEHKLPTLLNDTSAKESTYYKAIILQKLVLCNAQSRDGQARIPQRRAALHGPYRLPLSERVEKPYRDPEASCTSSVP